MSLKIVIDGYNLLNVSLDLQRLAARDLEAARHKLLCALDRYSRITQHELTVVFDGWRSGYPVENRDRVGRVDVIYSRQGEKADEVIKRLAESGHAGVWVVTSDREVAGFAKTCGATVVGSGQFDARVRSKNAAAETPLAEKDAEPEELTGGKKKGPAYRPSRKVRQMRSTLKRL